MALTRKPVIVVVATLAAAIGSASASAAPPGFIDQYQEPFPIAGGNDYTGGGEGGGGNGSVDLPTSVQTQLEGAVSPPVAQALETIATSADLGAPQTSLAPAKGLPDGDGAPGASGDSAGAVADGNYSTAIVEESPHLLALLGAIAMITLVGIAAFLLRRRVAAASVD